MNSDLLKTRDMDEARATQELGEFLGVAMESLAEAYLEVSLTTEFGQIIFTMPRDEPTYRILGRLAAYGYAISCALTDDNYFPLSKDLFGQITGRPDEIDPPDRAMVTISGDPEVKSMADLIVVGGGGERTEDSFTDYRAPGLAEHHHFYVYSNGTWEHHDLGIQMADASEEARRRGVNEASLIEYIKILRG